ncbi:MAG: ATP-binding protein, partial [Gammaproteobacteria bacterium]|nr:ATP-binding protein [Gammaproteobacteria bacterium]
MAKAKIRFPWIGTLIAIAGSSFLFISTKETYLEALDLPFWLMEQKWQIITLAVVIITLIVELDSFRRNRIRFDQQIENYEKKLAEILRGKATLQNKVNVYADHADKLKVFISDRLLEYIEYDEKFLHFKSIASEVRHNGIISYDKVRTALVEAQNQISDNENHKEIYEEAIRSMRYLWDLLDLSTTDNIAMYIANKLYEYEEAYYAQELNKDKEVGPYKPTYDIRNAILVSLKGFIQETENPLPKFKAEEDDYNFDNKQYHVRLHNPGELLGNENYIVLLMENLINNALFYAANKKYGNKHSKISLRLDRLGPYARIRCYNAGPNIVTDRKDEIFQLGYSTRRTKDNHGKGLGLYFVNEIVKGNEGKIDYTNVENTPDTYIFRIELDDGTKLNDIIHTGNDTDGKPACTTARKKTPQKEIEFETDIKIKTIEVSVQSLNQTFSFNEFEPNKSKTTTFLDPHEPAIPRWSIDVQRKSKPFKIVFRPLDVTGVEFKVLVPTATSRLDADFHALETDELERLEQLDVDMDMDTI